MPLLIVAVIVALAVGAPVVVAALLNGSEIVKVIDAVDAPQVACSSTVSIAATVSFRFTSAATTTGAITSTPTQWLGQHSLYRF